MTVYRGCDIPSGYSFDVEADLWIRFEDGVARLGLTDVAQTRMGQMVSIRFKRAGRRVKAGGSVATVESAKWVGPVHTPFAGEVVAGNEEAFERDILIANRDPYGEGWISVVRPDDTEEITEGLLAGEDALTAYRERIDELDVSCFRCAD